MLKCTTENGVQRSSKNLERGILLLQEKRLNNTDLQKGRLQFEQVLD